MPVEKPMSDGEEFSIELTIPETSLIEHRVVSEQEFLDLVFNTLRDVPFQSASGTETFSKVLVDGLSETNPDIAAAKGQAEVVHSSAVQASLQLREVMHLMAAYKAAPEIPVAIHMIYSEKPILALETSYQVQEGNQIILSPDLGEPS